MKKRILSFILVLMMMLTMIPVLETEAKAAAYASYTGVDFANANISSQRKAALTKAMQMVTITWVCPADFPTWRSSPKNGSALNPVVATDGTVSQKFIKGKKYTGIPYSMKDNSFDDVSWANALSSGKITTSYMTDTYYGNGDSTAHGTDCSRMVYYALKAANAGSIGYQTTAQMLNSPYYTKISWEQLQSADLFLVNGHVMMFVGKSGSNYAVFECDAGDSKCSYNVYSKTWLTNNGYGCYRYNGFGAGNNPSTQSYIEVYPKSYDTRISVYKSAGGEKLSNRYIDGSTDICRILQFSGDWCYVSYPSDFEADGWFEAWVPLSTFTVSTKGKEWIADKDYTLYRRTDKKDTFGSVSKGTECTVTDEVGNLKQVTFRVNNTARMGWVEVQTHTHNYSKKVTNPTCTEQGYTTYTCSCGDSYKGDYISATGHKTELRNVKSVTCTSDGYTGDEVCKTCGKTVKTGKTINSIGHKWNSGKIVKDATCETAGEKKFTCENDSSHTKTESIPAIGHKDTTNDYICDICGKSLCTNHSSVTVNIKAATCTTNGYTGDEVCKNCGKTIKIGRIIEATGHNWDSGKITKEATCEVAGEKKFTCQNDSSHTKTETIPATGHAYYAKVITKPTCTEKGYSTYQCVDAACDSEYVSEYVDPIGHKWTVDEFWPATCENDGYKSFICENDSNHTKTEPIPAVGHTTELKNKKAATCTTDGYTGDEVCKICGKTVKSGEVIKALGHDWMEDTFVPGCEFDGWTVHWCTRCSEEYEDNYVSATGHKWDDGKVIKEATETAEGIKRFTCTVCKETDDRTIPVIDHKHSFKGTLVKPTCTESGYTLHECACGESFKDSYTDALGHDIVLKNKKTATCTADGYTGDEVCKTCGKTVKSGKVITATDHKWNGGKCTVCGATDPDYKEPTPITNPFVDVKDTDWFCESVMWAVENGVTGGTSPITFSPNNSCTRAQVVTFLWAANGRPEPISEENPFKDVKEDDWYYKPVLWAVKNGITSGIRPGEFGPNETCTRAQVVTFLYAANGKPNVLVYGSTFTDVGVNDWFKEEVQGAVENGVTGGIGNGKFGPNNTCTRGQVVTFLYKVYGNK